MFDKNLTKPKFTFLFNRIGDLQTTGSLTDDSTGAVNLGVKEIGILTCLLLLLTIQVQK